MRRSGAVIVIAALVALASAIAASPALAAFGLSEFRVKLENESGLPATQAGAHPFGLTTHLSVNVTEVPEGVSSCGSPVCKVPDGELRDLAVDLPPGLVGDPKATPRCSSADFGDIDQELKRPACPNDTAVGLVNSQAEFTPLALGVTEKTFWAPVYNLEPEAGSVAKFGFIALGVPVTMDVHVSERGPGDMQPYHVEAVLTNVSQALIIYEADLTLWGNPVSPVHNEVRGHCIDSTGGNNGELVSLGSCPVTPGTPEKALLTMPRSCATPLFASYRATSWQSPAGVVPAAGASQVPIEVSGCDGLGFQAGIKSVTSERSAESPSGLDFELGIHDPGLVSVSENAASDLQQAVVTLPTGVTTNPSIANGLQSCSQAQYELESAQGLPGSGCPEASKIGSLEVETPVLEGEILTGSLYVGKQVDNPFHNLLTIYLVIKDPELGILIRAAGKVDPDPVNGRLTTTFPELPQFPFSSFRLHFREGPRAPLITPPLCGSYSTLASLQPFVRPSLAVAAEAQLEITNGASGAPCVGSESQLPDSPNFTAGTLQPQAGAFSPFVLSLSRNDGSQRFSTLNTTLPQGLLAKLAGIPYCSEAQIGQAQGREGELQGSLEQSSPSCPASSQIGTVTVGSGAGPDPLYVEGKAFLAGPYKGAPLSLEIITPALAGPFDLGVVAVRTALRINPVTTQVTAESDPIPTILHGLPLDVRSIAVKLDRANFTLNPTSCEPKVIEGSVGTTAGGTASIEEKFQARNCLALNFGPKLRVGFKGSLKRSGNPAISATLTQPAGQAGIAAVTTVLPKTEFIDNAHINNPCTRVQFAANSCPPKSVLGRAKAWSPLLADPLSGPVYFRSNGGERELPDIVAVLNGQIHVEVIGYIDSVRKKGAEISRVRTRFLGVPDAPVSKFTLELAGGKRGLLENTRNLCKGTPSVSIKMRAQNGRSTEDVPKLDVRCKPPHHKLKQQKH